MYLSSTSFCVNACICDKLVSISETSKLNIREMELDINGDVDRLSSQSLSQSQSVYSSDEESSSDSDLSQVWKGMFIFLTMFIYVVGR